MKANELLKMLDQLDQEQNMWLFTTGMFRTLFPADSPSTQKSQLKRLTQNGLLAQVCRGIYANERARCMPVARLEAVVPYLRPSELTYLSQESRLSDLGLISQMLIDRLTLVTTGRSHTYQTLYGTLEFTHTSKSPEKILDETTLNKETELLEASENLALRDLKRAGRNVHMISDRGGLG
jgi:hypothetical protein